MRDDRNRAIVEVFYLFVGASLIATVVRDVSGGVWDVHAGRLFPWRHVWPFPLWSTRALIPLWALLGASGLALAVGFGRAWAVRLALIATGAGLTQSFSNARALLLIVLAFLALDPPNPRATDFTSRAHPTIALVKAQLVVVYLFSAANKIVHGFLSGASLVNLLGYSYGVARVFAIITVLVEIALPALLVRAPVAGIAVAAAMHVTFALLLPGLWPFTLLTIGMAILFAGDEPPLFSRAKEEGDKD
jgi:hypothetical protein